MATKVTVNYTPSFNTSVTTKNGRITKVTLWVTGQPAKDTDRTYGK